MSTRFDRVDLAWIRYLASDRIVRCDDEISDRHAGEEQKIVARRDKAELLALLHKAEARLAKIIPIIPRGR